MKRIDALIGAYYSPEVEAIKTKAKTSFVLSIVTGVFAVLLFTLFGVGVFFSLLFQYNPLKNPLLLLALLAGIPLFFLLIPTSWGFSIRYIWLCNKAKNLVDKHMRDSIVAENESR